MTDYGTVKYLGKTYTLTQAAYVDRLSDTDSAYYASATCPDYPDATIRVYWDIIADTEDESEACNWDKPAGVRLDGEEVEAVEARKSAARALGSSRSPAKVAASRENGKKGGRPIEREHSGLSIRYTGPGQYWANAPVGPGLVGVGECRSLDDVISGVDAIVSAGSGDEDWTGWTVSK